MTIRELIENGTITLDTEVLGTLPKTKDGVIAVAPAKVYFGTHEFVVNRHITTPMFPVVVVKDGTVSIQEYLPVPIEECYSNREAARAARGGVE